MDNDNCEAGASMVVGAILGAVLTGIFSLWLSNYNSKLHELACRDGKLFEVTHEGNITIYDPTFDDCEVKE